MASTNLAVIAPSSPGSPSYVAVAKVMSSFTATRRELASQWAALSPADVEQHYAGPLGQIHRLIISSGVRDTLPGGKYRTFIAHLKASPGADAPVLPNPGKLLAAMLFLYPHELPHIHPLAAVPQWLIQDYLNYTLVAVPMFREIGEAEAYCSFLSRWT